MAVHPIGPLRDIDTLDAATNRNCETGSRLPPPRWFQPRAISAQLSHARISAPSSTESYDIIYITFCDANQERHRNATPRSCAQIESYLLRSGRNHAALRNTVAGSRKQATVDVACLENAPEKTDKPPIPHSPPNTLEKQPVMNRVEGGGHRLPITAMFPTR